MRVNDFELEAQAADLASALALACFDAACNAGANAHEGFVLMQERAASDVETATGIVAKLARELLEQCGE